MGAALRQSGRALLTHYLPDFLLEGCVVDVEAAYAGSRLNIEIGARRRPAPGYGYNTRQERPAR
jgi:hypothetical protein